nr:hypothetical protein [Tanacetum cinerariifolium]
MHTIVWRNRSDLDTMSLDDMYNHLKVYESEVQKKSDPNPQNMAFISSAKHIRGNEDVNTASTNIPTASVNIGDINQIDEDDIEEIDIKWNMALLSMRADKFWKKISIQGTDVAEFDKSKSYIANDEENHALVADEEAPTEFALMADTSAEIKNMIYHYKLGLVQVESRLVEHKDREIKYCEKIRGLEFKTESSDDYIEILKKELETLKKEKEGLDGKLVGFQTASKDLDSLLKSH